MAREAFDNGEEDVGSQELVWEAQEKAANSARTVGDFRTKFHGYMHETLADENKRHASAAFRERAAVVDDATVQNQDLHLDELDAGTLGLARIQGGRTSIRMGRSMFRNLRNQQGVQQVVHAGAHEITHAEDVVVHGQFIYENKAVDPLLLYEGRAELAGNHATARGRESHRQGQPTEVYKQGQDLVVDLLHKIPRAKMDAVFRGSGDLNILTDHLARR
jgi:hypothetical protein